MRTKQKSLAFTINLKIYPFYLRVSIGESNRQVKNFFKSLVGKKELKFCKYSRNAAAICVMFDSGAGMIRLKKIPGNPKGFSFLQHEITHYVEFVLTERIGMQHTTETTEAFCYLTGYITKQIYKKLPLFK